MKFKPKYLVILMVLFLVVVFLDQNRHPVPIKFIVGTPLPVDLSLIIVFSLVVGGVLTCVSLYLINRRRKLKKQIPGIDNQR